MKHPLESEMYHFIRGIGERAFDAFTNSLVQIETYDLYKEKMTVVLMGFHKEYQSSAGAILGFYVNAYDDPCGNGVDLMYSFKDLDTAMDLINELKGKVETFYLSPAKETNENSVNQ